MITTKFVSNGIRYHIEHGTARREREEMALDIKPDKSLWSTRQRRVVDGLRVDQVGDGKSNK